MFTELFSYDPKEIEPEYREQMASIIKARSEYLRAAAEVAEYRARAWAGDGEVNEVAEMKAADLAKLRQDYSQQYIELFKASVDVEGLKKMLPMVALAVFQNLKVPVPVLLEAIGIDLDMFKFAADNLKELISDQ